jgi:hypothetical protein
MDTIYAYNSLRLNINKNHIVSAFQEGILNDAKFVPSIEADPNPHMDAEAGNDVDAAEVLQEGEDCVVSQYEDEPLDDSSADELPEEMPSMRRPRQAHNLTYDARLAQIYQASINKT